MPVGAEGGLVLCSEPRASLQGHTPGLHSVKAFCNTEGPVLGPVGTALPRGPGPRLMLLTSSVERGRIWEVCSIAGLDSGAQKLVHCPIKLPFELLVYICVFMSTDPPTETYRYITL